MAAPLLSSAHSSTRQSSLRRTANTSSTSSSKKHFHKDAIKKRSHSAISDNPDSADTSTITTTATRGQHGSKETPHGRLEARVVIPRKRLRQDDGIQEMNGNAEETGSSDSDNLQLENASNKRVKKSLDYAIRPKTNGRAAESQDNSHNHARTNSTAVRTQVVDTNANPPDRPGSRHARGGRVAKAAQPPPSASVVETTDDAGSGTADLTGKQENGTQTVNEQQSHPTSKKEKKTKRVELRIDGESAFTNSQGLVHGAQPQKAHASTIDGNGERPSSSGTAVTGAGQEKRTLRSQDGGSRTKSELSLYFPHYDEFISNEPKEEELLKAETRVFITEDPISKSPSSSQKSVQIPPEKLTPRKRRASQSLLSTPNRTPATAAASSLSAAAALTLYQKLDFTASLAKLEKQEKSGQPVGDALTPELYAAAHRRSERQEKQLRNIEKERAQHEKVQLERLYDGLRGPDWLRVMGISGVTESERKGWEGKRAYFVKEVGALLEKFRLWREEERRRKIEKEQHDREVDESDEMDTADEVAQEDGEQAEVQGEEEMQEPTESQERRKAAKGPRHKSSPASSDVDAMAAQQLHAEALLSSTSTKHPPLPSPSMPSTPKQGRRRKASGIVLPTEDPMMPQKPMTSFFAKNHQRDAALKNSKRIARTQYAFGQPVPELEEAVFELPDDYLTADAKRASARSRRRARRQGRDG